MLCSFYGKNVTAEDAFCNSCGASLTEEVEITVEMPTVAKQPTSAVYPQYKHPIVVDYPRKRRNIVAKISMVLGIIAIGFSLVWFMCCVSVPFSVAAFITGIVGAIRKERRFFAIAEIGLALVAITLFLLQIYGVFYLY